MSNEHILYEIDHQGVANVTLNRPDKHNAFDEHVIADLTATFEQVGAEKNVLVMVLRANGKNFCAGADVNWMKRVASYSHEENIRDANALAKMLHTLNFLPIPTIAR